MMSQLASIARPSGNCSTGTVALGDMAGKLTGLARKLTSTASKSRPAYSSAMRTRIAQGPRRKVQSRCNRGSAGELVARTIKPPV